MKRIVLTVVLAFAAGLITGKTGGTAQADVRREFVVPKNWGTFRAVYHDQLLFEDDHGTIRSVFPNGSTVVFVISRR